MEEIKMKIIIKRMVKFVLNEVRRALAIVTKNKNLEVDSYLYDMTTLLKRDLGVTKRDSQYVMHIGNNPICILNKSKSIHVLDMNRFQKIKHSLMRIGGTPKQAYNNIDSLFESKTRNGDKPVSVTIKR